MRRLSRDSNPRRTPKRAGLQKVAAEKGLLYSSYNWCGERDSNPYCTDFKSVASYRLRYHRINFGSSYWDRTSDRHNVNVIFYR